MAGAEMAKRGAAGNQTGKSCPPPSLPHFPGKETETQQVTDLSRVVHLISDRASLIPCLLTLCLDSLCCPSAATNGKEPTEREGRLNWRGRPWDVPALCCASRQILADFSAHLIIGQILHYPSRPSWYSEWI